MPIIARFSFAAEAAFFQTLLEEKGIPSTLLDSGSGAFGVGNIATADIDTPQEYVEQATAIYIEYSKDNKERADKAEQTHLNKGFPFLAIWALLAVAIWIAMGVLWFVSKHKLQITSADIWYFGLTILSGIFCGLALAWSFILWRTMINSVVRRFRK